MPTRPVTSPSTTSTPSLTGSTDASFSFSLEFRNDTAQDVTLSVSALGEIGWDVTATLTGEAQAASTVVEAGSTQGVTVAVVAPEDAAAGTYPITVEAQAGERTATAELAVEITGSYSLTLTTPDDRLSTSGSAGSPTTLAFEVTNTGTAAAQRRDRRGDPAERLGRHLRSGQPGGHRPGRDRHGQRDDHPVR